MIEEVLKSIENAVTPCAGSINSLARCVEEEIRKADPTKWTENPPADPNEFHGASIEMENGSPSFAHRAHPITGNLFELTLPRGSSYYELTDLGCEKFNQVVSVIQEINGVNTHLGRKFTQDCLMQWLSCPKGNFADGFLGAARSAINEYDVWVPVSSLVISHEIPFGPARVVPLSKKLFDEWERLWLNRFPRSQRDLGKNLFSDLRSRFQGKSVVLSHVVAEQGRAGERAIEIAERACESLRLLHPGMFCVEFTAAVRPEGMAHIRKGFVFFGTEGSPSFFREEVHEGSLYFWRIERSELAKWKDVLISRHAAVMFSYDRSEFQELVVNAIRHYSWICLHKSIGEKLLCLFSTLEMLLVRKRENKIGGNIAKRLAMAIGDCEGDRVVADLVAECYRLRSDFVHGGRKRYGEADRDKINRLLYQAHGFVVEVLSKCGDYKDKEHYISTLERGIGRSAV